MRCAYLLLTNFCVKSAFILKIRNILRAAKERNLEVVPLVQSFGHLEWILKLEPFIHLREDAQFPQVICFGSDAAFLILRSMIDQVSRPIAVCVYAFALFEGCRHSCRVWNAPISCEYACRSPSIELPQILIV